jgi:thiol-disulfide isomerase/thioredoxin
MRKLLALLMLAVAVPVLADDTPTVDAEAQVAKAVQSDQLTVVHFWAPWCPNCKNELKDNKWQAFIEANPTVNFVFVTTWNDKDGHEALAKFGVGPQKNFTLLLPANTVRKGPDRMKSFMGLPVTWIPSTWIFKGGKLLYALNYGELRFTDLQQLVKDSTADW